MEHPGDVFEFQLRLDSRGELQLPMDTSDEEDMTFLRRSSKGRSETPGVSQGQEQNIGLSRKPARLSSDGGDDDDEVQDAADDEFDDGDAGQKNRGLVSDRRKEKAKAKQIPGPQYVPNGSTGRQNTPYRQVTRMMPRLGVDHLGVNVRKETRLTEKTLQEEQGR